MAFLKLFKPLLIITFLFVSISAVAEEINKEQEADPILAQLYHNLQQMPNSDMEERIEAISNQFQNKPYLLGALGEGASGRFDQYPLYRTDAFDCETFVDTVLAVALANNQNNFKQCMDQIRYLNGQVSFLARNHFTDLDWNKNNQDQGFLKDITTKIQDQKNVAVYKIASAQINKPGWYSHFTLTNIRLREDNPTERSQRLSQLKLKGKTLETVNSTIPYIPLSALFDETGKENVYLFKQIPNASVIEIVRPNWDLSKQIGTNLNVSHLGFAFWKQNVLMFSQASSDYGKTVNVPLVEYLRNALKSPTIKGINVQIVVPEAAFEKGCNPGVPQEKLKES
jgi:hypothetical protein